MVSGNQVHFVGRGFAAAAFEPLQDIHEGSVAVARRHELAWIGRGGAALASRLNGTPRPLQEALRLVPGWRVLGMAG
jgi:hypothetical protein